MTPSEFRRRRDELMGQERERKVLNWHWLSFATEEGFQGAALIKAWGPITAHYVAKLAAPDLAGQVRMEEMPDWYNHDVQVNAWLRLRPSIMRTREEVESFDVDFEKFMQTIGYELEKPN